MRVLITGAAGMLGQDLYDAAILAGHDAVALAHGELDITDPAAVHVAVASARPDVVINSAAWTDVDGAEAHEAQATKVNGAGAGHVAAAAQRAGAWMIQVSSDYVFDGHKREPYVESDPVGPKSAYGRSKLAGEREVARAAPERHTTVRSSWLFGVGGSCFPRTIARLAAERDELSVVADQVGCPTFTGHLAAALVELASAPDGPPVGTLHVAAAEECSWFQFAREIVAANRLECEVKPASTAELPRPAARPAYSVMRSERSAPELPAWTEGLAEYLRLCERAAA
jgi:dTDP-4-dehydrorhamnose reductase